MHAMVAPNPSVCSFRTYFSTQCHGPHHITLHAIFTVATIKPPHVPPTGPTATAPAPRAAGTNPRSRDAALWLAREER